MTSEEMERAIEFLLESQAKNSTNIAFTNEAVNKLAETVAQDRLEDRGPVGGISTRKPGTDGRISTRDSGAVGGISTRNPGSHQQSHYRQ